MKRRTKKSKIMASLLTFWCCVSLNAPAYATTGSVAATFPRADLPVTQGTSTAQEDRMDEQNSLNQEDITAKNITHKRLSGDTRYGTAKVISEYFSAAKVKNIVLTTGNEFADALSASVLAGQLQAPILLVDSTTEKSQDAFAYVRENLEPEGRIYIIGGKGIIGEEFEAELHNFGFKDLVRIEGKDRYDTSYQIACALGAGNVSTVIISSGEQYPDALSISGFAANQGWPILLSPQTTLPQEVKKFLREKQPAKVYITGGTGAISENVLAEITGLLPLASVERLAGQSRFDTNVLIAKTFAENPMNLFLTTGNNFADALAGSVVAAQTGDPIVFIDPNSPTLPKPVANYLGDLYLNELKPQLVTFGGSGVVSAEIVENVTDLLTGRAKVTSIHSIPEVTATVAQGGKFPLPISVQARLYNSDKVDMAVKWNTTVVDTSALGLKVFEGIVEGYGKTVKLNLKVTDPLPVAEYSTHFNPQEINRTENIRLAAKAIDGKVLAPGESFSFNETVGERTYEAGYKEAIVIEGKAFIPGLGGGICQVSSTLYNAADLAKLEIVERNHHSLTVGYVPPGRDATVAWPVLDFKFRNNTADNLIIRTSVGEGILTIKLFKK